MAAQQRVLVVVDPTASLHPAIERAAWLARAVPSVLELFICDYASQLADTRGSDSAIADARTALIARHKTRLEQLAAPLAAQGLRVTVDSRWDYPLHDGIVRKALDFKADLVIKDRMASRSHGKIERRLDKFVLTDHSANGTFVLVEGDREIVLRREEFTLRGHGWIAFGHSLLSMSGFEALAQVYREVAYPKLKNLKI